MLPDTQLWKVFSCLSISEKSNAEPSALSIYNVSTEGFLITNPSSSMGRQNLTPEGASTRRQETPKLQGQERKS